jgi:hypothetical protein
VNLSTVIVTKVWVLLKIKMVFQRSDAISKVRKRNFRMLLEIFRHRDSIDNYYLKTVALSARRANLAVPPSYRSKMPQNVQNLDY